MEQALCAVIARSARIKLRYDDDLAERLVDPYGVFSSTTGKVLMVCHQIDNPEKPIDKYEPRYFEVANIRSLIVTRHTFTRDSRFDPSDKRYSKGFICQIKCRWATCAHQQGQKWA